MKINLPEESSSIWWRLTNFMKNQHSDENSSLWWKFINLVRIHHFDENSSTLLMCCEIHHFDEKWYIEKIWLLLCHSHIELRLATHIPSLYIFIVITDGLNKSTCTPISINSHKSRFPIWLPHFMKFNLFCRSSSIYQALASIPILIWIAREETFLSFCCWTWTCEG